MIERYHEFRRGLRAFISSKRNSSDAESPIQRERRTRKTLYAITGLYVVLGFMIAVPSAWAGDRVNTFLGFLIIGGALGIATAVSVALRSWTQVLQLDTKLGDVFHRLEQIREQLNRLEPPIDKRQHTKLVDLTQVGTGDPSPLVAASLQRDRFPRLVTTMDDQPPAQATTPPDRQQPGRPFDPSAPTELPVPSITTINLLREWRIGMRNKDLSICRRVFAAIVDTASPAESEPLRAQLEQLARATEEELRAAFTACAHARDYLGMLEVGQRILAVLPDRPVAGEFANLEPALRRRLLQEDAPRSSLRIVP